MNKKRTILGMLIAIIMVVCGACLVNVQSPVFAMETKQPILAVESPEDAGTFVGEGEYTAGQTANLTAVLKPQYMFDCWLATFSDGVTERISSDLACSYYAMEDVTITAEYRKAGDIYINDAFYSTEDDLKFFKVGQAAKIQAVACPGFEFVQWNLTYEGGGTDIITEAEYTFVVAKNTTVTPIWRWIEYSLSFDTDLNDFEYSVENLTRTEGVNYYDDKIKITFEVKEGLYIYDIEDKNILIGGNRIFDIIRNDNPMKVNCDITNKAGETGFEKFEVTLNIRENIFMDVEHETLNKMQVVSGNDIEIEELVDAGLIRVVDAYSNIDVDNNVYLVRANRNVKIRAILENGVFVLENVEVTGELPKKPASDEQSYKLHYRNNVFKVNYNRIKYAISFKTYLTNVYGGTDEVDFYTIENANISVGQTIEFAHTVSEAEQTISVSYPGSETDYKKEIIGYQFDRFAINGEDVAGNSYTLVEEDILKNIEIQIIFKYIEYNSYSIVLVDLYFEDGVEYSVKYDNVSNKLIKGTDIIFTASSNKYKLVGWSESSNPKADGYIETINEGVTEHTITLTDFEPTSNDASFEYKIYLDVEYKYISTTYKLGEESIVKNMDYDIVSVDKTNLKITFIDSESINPSFDISIKNISESPTEVVIQTEDYGNFIIKDNVLTYTLNYIELTSASMSNDGDIEIYYFDKYTYLGKLEIAAIESVELKDDDGTNVTIVLNGIRYTHDSYTSGVINSITTTKTFDGTKNAYKINCGYAPYLYMNEAGTDYEYILLRDVKFNYDESSNKFIVDNATINKPKTAELITQSQSMLTLGNLLPSSVVVYYTSPNVENAKFTHFTDKIGTELVNFDYLTGKCTVLPVALIDEVYATYIKTTNSVSIIINPSAAYAANNVQYSVQKLNGDIVTGTGGAITGVAQNEIVSIYINEDLVSKGYQFSEFKFAGTDLDDASSKISFVMDMDAVEVNIAFTVIEYTLKVVYLNSEGAMISDPASANGTVQLQTKKGDVANTMNLTGEYIIKATAKPGYYVNEAYMGMSMYELPELKGSNDSNKVVTQYEINASNFEDAIIDNSRDGNIFLYIEFAIHTYKVKVYLEYNEQQANPALKYPSVFVGVPQIDADTKASLLKEEDIGDGKTRKYIEKDGIEQGSQVEFLLENFMLGTMINRWEDSSGTEIPVKNSYKIVEINSNTELKIVLQFVLYNINYQVVDEHHNPCEYGSITSKTTQVKLFGAVKYTINASEGYILYYKFSYYPDNSINWNDITADGSYSLDSGFIFNPANFLLTGDSVTIYVVFKLKEVNITISNIIDAVGYDAATLATTTVKRIRGGAEPEVLEDVGSGYNFQTNDILQMELVPSSIGFGLKKSVLDSINISFEDMKYCKLQAKNLLDGDNKIIGVYYELQVEFHSSIINSMPETVYLINNLYIKKFDFVYKYNCIGLKDGEGKGFGISLVKTDKNGFSSITSDPDTALEFNLEFGTEFILGYDSYDKSGSRVDSKFNILGIKILNDLEPRDLISEKFTFSETALWEELALKMHVSKLSKVDILLAIEPKITLNNGTLTEGDEYLYQRYYKGESQGLTTSGDNPDIVIVDFFEIVVEYLSDGGLKYSDELPIDVGRYDVKISAKSGEVKINYTQKVTFEIIPAILDIYLATYDADNPIIKKYNRTSAVDSGTIISDIQFIGVKERDKGEIFLDEKTFAANFSGVAVNTKASMYNVYISGLKLRDEDTKPAKNYILKEGVEKTFEGVGLVTPKKLDLIGYEVKNKVYNGKDDLIAVGGQLDTSDIVTGDVVTLDAELLRFYLEDFTVGESREVFIDYSNAISGADSGNYQITYLKKYINIHPYELYYTISGYGTVRVVDRDNLCAIPIGAKLYAEAHDKGSSEYRSRYDKLETVVGNGEKLKICYEISITGKGGITLQISEGLYVYLPKASKVEKIVQMTGKDSLQNLPKARDGEYIVIKAKEGETFFGVVVKTTYLPLWVIILIVAGSLSIVGALVGTFIVIRRRTKNKYSSYDKI